MYHIKPDDLAKVELAHWIQETSFKGRGPLEVGCSCGWAGRQSKFGNHLIAEVRGRLTTTPSF